MTRVLRHARRAIFAALLPLALAADTGLAQGPGERTPARDAAFAEARALADAQRFDEAIARARDLADRAAGVYDYRLFFARCLGWDARHDASADAFEVMASRFPEQVPDFGPEWAKQLLWAGRHEEAVACYDRLLAADPENTELLAGRARAISWSGDAQAAVRAYRDLVAEVPTSGAYRVGYAQNLRWTGRESEARRFLRRIPEASRSSDEQELLDALSRSARAPWARAAFSTSTDSDDLDIRIWDFEGGYGPSDRFWVGASLRHDRFEGSGRSVDITRLGGIVRLREGPFSASLHLRVGDADPVDFTPVTGRAGATLRVADRIELGIDAERTDYASFLAFERKVIGQFVTGTLRALPVRRADAAISVGAGAVTGSDVVETNTRVHGALDAGVVVWTRPRLRAFGSLYAFSFSARTADGYWNPDDYVTAVVGLDFNPSFPVIETDLVIAGNVGVQKETPRESGGTGALTIRVINRSLRVLSIEYRFDTTDSRLASDRGFDRTQHTLSVSGAF